MPQAFPLPHRGGGVGDGGEVQLFGRRVNNSLCSGSCKLVSIDTCYLSADTEDLITSETLTGCVCVGGSPLTSILRGHAEFCPSSADAVALHSCLSVGVKAARCLQEINRPLHSDLLIASAPGRLISNETLLY